jgi:hypothetical protein
MPFKSKAQRRFMYAAEARGEVPKGTAARWQKETDKKKLPEKVASMSPFDIGVEDALIKSASYLSESARTQRKIERHGKRGHGPEKSRLAEKGRRQGMATGKALGGLMGAAGGAYMGSLSKKPGLGALAGGLVGGLGGAVLGRGYGASIGHAQGRREADRRQEAYEHIKNMSPKQREKFFRNVTSEQQRERELEAREDMARAMRELNRS